MAGFHPIIYRFMQIKLIVGAKRCTLKIDHGAVIDGLLLVNEPAGIAVGC